VRRSVQNAKSQRPQLTICKIGTSGNIAGVVVIAVVQFAPKSVGLVQVGAAEEKEASDE